jgi:hypothetical protein
MVVTYFGNRLLTWRGRSAGDRRREVGLFIAFNVVGMGISVACLVLSHDVLGLTSRLADNISANVVGLALGTLFRFWSYRAYVFAPPGSAGAASTAIARSKAPSWAAASSPGARRAGRRRRRWGRRGTGCFVNQRLLPYRGKAS